MVNKPYFLLVFEKGDTMPTIISAEIISEIYPDADEKNNGYCNRNWQRYKLPECGVLQNGSC